MPERPAKTKYSYFIFIFFAAVALRAAYEIFLKKYYFFYDNPAGDVGYYQAWAQEVRRGNWIGNGTFFGLPLYPYFLAVVKSMSLSSEVLAKAMHIILGGINSLLISFVALKIFDRKVSILTGILAAVNFTLFFYDTSFMPVTLEIFFSLLIVCFFLHQQLLINLRQWFLLGILIGIGSLGDGKLVIAALLISGVLLLSRTASETRGLLVSQLVMMLIGLALVITATGLRNKFVGGSWVWISAQSGLSFYVGNNEQATGIYEHPSFLRPDHSGQDEDQVVWAQLQTGRNLTDAEVSRFWRDRGIAFIRSNPSAYWRLLGKKFFHFLRDDEATYDVDMVLQRDIKAAWDINPFFLLLPWALLGMAVSRANTKTLYVNVMIFAQLIFVLIFFMSYRHRATVLPFLLMYQAVGILWLVSNLLVRKYLRAGAAVFLVLMFVWVFFPRQLDSAEYKFLLATKRGSVFEKNGFFEQARVEYHKALTVHPEDTNTLYNLGYTYVREKRFAEAAKHYRKVLDYNPAQVDALYNLAFVSEELGLPEDAIIYYQQVVQLQPYSVDSRYRLGRLYYQQRKCPQAVEQLEAIRRLRPEFSAELQGLISSCQ